MKVICMNGPKLSGKTTIAAEYAWLVNGESSYPLNAWKLTTAKLFLKAEVLSVARGIQEAAWARYGFGPAMVDTIENNGKKDENMEELDWRTPREIYIKVGNELRKEFGERHFADMWLKKASEKLHEVGVLIMPDCRFTWELDAAVRLVGKDNVLLVLLSRDGCTWKNDIGSYLQHDKQAVLVNNSTLSDATHRLDTLFGYAFVEPRVAKVSPV